MSEKSMAAGKGSEALVLRVDESVLDSRAVVIGLLVCVLFGFGGTLWKLATKTQTLKRPEEFVFSTAEPPPEDIKFTEPPREIVKESEEKPDDKELEESPNIQVSTNPAQIDNPQAVIKSSNIDIETPRIDVGATEISPQDAPVELREVSDEQTFALQPIAADTAGPADLYKYTEPTPSNVVAKDFISRGSRPSKAIKVMPKQFGDQNAPTMGQLGPADINLFGTGDFFRMRSAGGSIKERTAVDWALQWLAIHQETDGSWKTEKYEGSEGAASTNLAATALASLAFMGAGHNTRRGEYRRNVIRAIEYIRKNQDEEGCCKIAGCNHYTHALCAMALCEAYGRAHDDTLKSAAQRAVDYVQKAVLTDGGWRYRKGEPMSDVSVTAWFMQALKAAKISELKFDPALMAKAGVYLDGLTHMGASKDSNGVVGYTYQEDQNYTVGNFPAMTAAGMVIRQFNGMGVKNHILVKGADRIRMSPPDWKKKSFYYWYYATYAMYNMGGEYRVWWNQRIRDVLLQNQSRSGDNAGSWDPRDEPHRASRVITTAFGALCLEVYYRYSEALTTYAAPPEIDELFLQGLQ